MKRKNNGDAGMGGLPTAGIDERQTMRRSPENMIDRKPGEIDVAVALE